MRNLIALVFLLTLTACAQSPGTGASPVTAEDPGVADQAQLDPPTPQQQETAAPPGPPLHERSSAFVAWLVDPAGEQPAEEVFFRPEPIRLLITSADGRFWLAYRSLGNPFEPFDFAVYDQEEDRLYEVGEIYPRFLAPSWTGNGFALGDLYSVERTESGTWRMVEHGTYQELFDLVEGETVIQFAMTPDERTAAAVVLGEQSSSWAADLVLARRDSGEVVRVREAIQPWPWGKQGPHVRLSISPDGSRLALLAPSPGTALIDTARPQREHWVAPLEPFVDLYGSWTEISSSGPPGGPVWASDSSRVWLPGGKVLGRDGTEVTKEGTSKPNEGLVHATGQVWQDRETWAWVLETPDGQQQTLDLAQGTLVHRFMPDGRLLVTLTRVY